MPSGFRVPGSSLALTVRCAPFVMYLVERHVRLIQATTSLSALTIFQDRLPVSGMVIYLRHPARGSGLLSWILGGLSIHRFLLY